MMLLDITLANGWLIFIGIVLGIIAWNLIFTNQKLQRQRDNYLKKSSEAEKMLQLNISDSIAKLKEQELIFGKKEAELKVSFQNWAYKEFEKFKNQEVDKIKDEAEKIATKAATILLQKWKTENEAKIRQDAINRSYSVNLGKITEQLVPFHQSFLKRFNPQDAKFIGNPIDLIVFDGYADKKDKLWIYFVEIKTGKSKLKEIQKNVKDAIDKGRVKWEECHSVDSSQSLIFSSDEEDSKGTPQLYFDFNKDEDLARVLTTLKPRNGETRDVLIDRVADAIDGVGSLIDDEGYEIKAAIRKQIANYDIFFSTETDEDIFINSAAKIFE